MWPGSPPAVAQAGPDCPQLASCLCRTHTGLGALRDQRPLELGHGTEHLQREHALWRRGVDRIAQRPEMRPPRLEILNHHKQVAHRARQAVEPHNHQDVAGADLAHQAGQHRPGPRGAGSVLLVQDLAAGGPQLVDLGVRRLFLG
jgi:hypothetical protein